VDPRCRSTFLGSSDSDTAEVRDNDITHQQDVYGVSNLQEFIKRQNESLILGMKHA
jgi:hypothetical protein